MSGAVPKLRFPQFKEEWVARRVSEVGEVITGATPDTAREDFYGGTVPFYSPGDIPEVPAVIDAASKMLTDAGLNSVRRVPKGASLFVCIGSTIGKVAFAGAAGATNQQINSVVPSSANDPYFVFLTLQKVARRVRQFAGTQAVPIINKSEFSNEVVFSTTLPEQQKIASFLGAVDGKISGLRRKEAALVRFKAGLMQKLFSQKLRFTRDDGSAFPDWRSVSLNEVLFEHKEKSQGSEAVFSVSVHKGLVDQVEHLGRSFSATVTAHYNRVLPGDVVYTKSPTGDFPMGIIKQSSIKVPVIVSPLYGVFSPETRSLGTILNEYFNSPVNTSNYLSPLVQKGAKNTIAVTNSRFLEGRLTLPRDQEEQRKIADAVSAMDAKITAVRSQISKMETFKKGLLQQMFV